MNTINSDGPLVSNIKYSEGLELDSYQDSVGIWTIGYGHTPSEEGQSCTQNQADTWLLEDIDSARNLALKLPEAMGLNPVRTDALIELMFNLGPHRWRLFLKCRAAIADKEFDNASKELLNSKWAGQVGPTRSNRIAKQLLTGAY